VGERVRETQWERGCGRHSGREGERDTVGERVRETQWERGCGRRACRMGGVGGQVSVYVAPHGVTYALLTD
jgi:hypothetical protein